MKNIVKGIKQYKNLILLVLLAGLLITLFASDPLGFCVQRAHDRAAIRNQMAIEKAEAEKEIAIIQAETEAELKRIRDDLTEEREVTYITESDVPEVETAEE